MTTVIGSVSGVATSATDKPSSFEIRQGNAVDYTVPGHEGEPIVVEDNPARNPQAVALATIQPSFDDLFTKAAVEATSLSSMFTLLPTLEGKIRIALNDTKPPYKFTHDNLITSATRFDEDRVNNLPSLINAGKRLAGGGNEPDLLKYIKNHDLSFTLRTIDKVRKGIKDANGDRDKIKQALLYMNTLLARVENITKPTH